MRSISFARAVRSIWIAIVCVSASAVAAADDTATPRRVAVLPVSLLAAPAETGIQIRERLADTLRRRFGVQVVDDAAVDAAVAAQCGDPARWWECLDRNEQLVQIGARLGVPLVVASNLGVMGETRLLKLRVVDVETRAVSGELVELKESDGQAVIDRFAALGERLFPQPSPPAWYQNSALWIAVGAGATLVVAAAAAATWYALTAQAPPATGDWDHQVSLP